MFEKKKDSQEREWNSQKTLYKHSPSRMLVYSAVQESLKRKTTLNPLFFFPTKTPL